MMGCPGAHDKRILIAAQVDQSACLIAHVGRLPWHERVGPLVSCQRLLMSPQASQDTPSGIARFRVTVAALRCARACGTRLVAAPTQEQRFTPQGPGPCV